MATHTITLTDTQEKCLRTVVADSKEWITNAAMNQARMAQENIIAALVTHCNNNEIAIATFIEANRYGTDDGNLSFQKVSNLELLYVCIKSK